MELKWSEVSHPRKQEALIWDCPFSKTANKPKSRQAALPQSFTFPHPEQLMPSSKLSRPKSVW
jgi:hypothetical protein